MKQAGACTQIIRNSDGEPWGVFLEVESYWAHQDGIERLLRQMRIAPNGLYTDGRSMKGPAELFTKQACATRSYIVEGKRKRIKDSILFLSTNARSLETPTERLRNVLRQDVNIEITAAWDQRDFKIAAWTKEAHAFLGALKSAAAQSNLTIYKGIPHSEGRPSFRYHGLVICITSLIPEDARSKINAEDEASEKLAQAVRDCGIVERIKNAPGIGYHALVPQFCCTDITRDGKSINLDTVYPVMFFLNPENQRDNNHGWFTVEELDQWIAGSGPIIKAREDA